MGLSSSKSTSGPSKQALPYINSATSAVTDSYQGNQANTAEISGGLSDAFKTYQSTMGDTLDPARTRVNDVLGGKLATGNPQLEGIIGQTNDSITDRVNAIFARSGQSTAGSTRAAGELGKQLSDNETRLRYQNYTDEQARIDQAVQQALGLNSADNANVATLAGLGETAINAPLINSNNYASGIGGLWGNATTTTQKQGLGQALLSAATAGAGIYKDLK